MQEHSKRLCFFLCTLQNKDEWRNGYTCAICAFEYNICWCILHKLHCGSCQLTWICVKLQQCWRSFISSGKFSVRFFARSLPLEPIWMTKMNNTKCKTHTNCSTGWATKVILLFLYCVVFLWKSSCLNNSIDRFDTAKYFNEQFDYFVG